MDTRYDTVCGLYCGACRAVQANEVGPAAVEAVAKEWGREPEQLVCHGCKSDVLASFCRDCVFKSCAAKKGIEHCFECGDFPCAVLIEFRDDQAVHHSAVVRNSEALREQGVEKWLEGQKERWSCPACGTRFWWYAKTCAACGAPVRNSEVEQAELDAESGAHNA